MNNTALTLLGVVIAVIVLHAFKASQTSSVTGHMKIDPKGSRIVARQGNDSVKTPVAADGSFRISLTKGSWQLEMERFNNQKQVQNIFIDSMTIREPEDIDLGNILPGL
ncbi:hypothetical protein [Flavitalea sp.]|nr:hypothetical protein [Flavitalea sp.]